MAQENYLEANQNYWEQGYYAPNVDHVVFRFFGKILRPAFGLPQNFEKLLDFGCGQGAAVNFFAQNGFDAYGVDISKPDVSVARDRYPHIANRFSTCDATPSNNSMYGPQEQYKVITAVQSLYYLGKADFEAAVQKLYDQLEPGGVFYATMMGTKSEEFYSNSTETDDPWLREVNFKNERITIENYFMFFIEDEEDLKEKFKLFKPLHTGYYACKLRSDEGDSFHYTFCGVKE